MYFDPNYPQLLSQAINQANATTQNLTSELSSGLRVTKLSDDPVAAADNVALSSSLNQLDSFVSSATAEQSQLQVGDNALGEVVSQVTSAITLATSAGNGTLNATDFRSLQTQVETIRASVLAAANTSYAGQYIFSGSQSLTRPYTLDTSTDPATATYHGDTTVQNTATPDGQQIQRNVAGSSVFSASGTDLLGTLNQLVSDLGAAASGTDATTAIQSDTAALSAALNTVSSQRSTLDSSLARLTSATTYANNQASTYQAAQSTLLAANPTTVATDLKAAETQQEALLSVAASIDGAQDLFSYLK